MTQELVSMVDYVEKCFREIDFPLKGIQKTKATYRSYVTSTIAYAKFLKQPLRLEMFVPCNDKGEPFQITKKAEFVGYLDSGSEDWQLTEEYKKAKEKVIFEGFEVKQKLGNTILIVHHPENKTWTRTVFRKNANGWKGGNSIIEDLCGLGLKIRTTKTD